MDAWALINLAFGGGWPPSEMDTMPLAEFHEWHDKAVSILEQKSKANAG